MKSYIKAKGYHVVAEEFMAYYGGNGWKVGRNPMKSWTKTLESWHYRHLRDHPELAALEGADEDYVNEILKGQNE